MPREFRSITFESPELVEAVVSYDQQSHQKLTCGIVESIDISDSAQMGFVVHISLFGERKIFSLELNPDYVGAALIMFCTNRNIPIPRHSIRFLKRIGENIALCFGKAENIGEENIFSLKII